MKWVEPQPVETPEDLLAAAGGSALVAQALVRRGLRSPQAALAFLDPEYYTPASPLELPDIAVAVERLRAAIARSERILVWGDFDVDGLTSTALLVEALEGLGAHVYWHVPSRQDSHGIHWHTLQPYLGQGVRVLLTCDTGVTAHHTLALAHNAGLDVLITDHHSLPSELPPALSVVNPHRLPTGHALSSLSGVGVAYELAAALNAPDTGLDLAALGLVADLALQQGDVRYLLQRGLRALRLGQRVGVQALLEVADVDAALLDETDIAFALAPRLNALGRLAQATAGVELFLTRDLARARVIASEAEAWNVRRQFLSKQVAISAQEQVRRDPALASSPVLVLMRPDWPGGVLGVAASRLVDRYYRPVVLISNPPGEPARGSARSVPGVDIHAALAAQGELLESFGGHPMAAGFAIAPERIPDFRRNLTRAVAAQVAAAPSEKQLEIEAFLPWSHLSLELHDQLVRLGPFGPGNPPIYLATRGLRIKTERTVGRTSEHRRLEVQDETGHTQSVLWWNGADRPLPEGCFDLAYRLDDNVYQEQRLLQVEWVDARWEERPAVEVTTPRAMAEVADYRAVAQPLPMLQALWDAQTMQLWAEGLQVPELPARGRHDLQPRGTLAVWTAPPGPKEWEHVLQRVQPQRVYLFAVDATLDAPEAFLRRLAGLVKHALDAYGGRLEWEMLAAATGQRIETVQAGARWLAARGVIALVTEGAAATATPGDAQRDAQAAAGAQTTVEALLRETAAYRAYWRTADARRLLA